MAERQHTEWKETWRDEYLKWICSFSNVLKGTPWGQNKGQKNQNPCKHLLLKGF